MKRIIPIITYIILAINTLYVFLLCLNICLYEVDLFLPIWIGSVIAIHTILVGLGLSIYALVQKDNPVFPQSSAHLEWLTYCFTCSHLLCPS